MSDENKALEIKTQLTSAGLIVAAPVTYLCATRSCVDDAKFEICAACAVGVGFLLNKANLFLARRQVGIRTTIKLSKPQAWGGAILVAGVMSLGALAGVKAWHGLEPCTMAKAQAQALRLETTPPMFRPKPLLP